MTSYDYQILRPSGSRNDKAILEAHVAEIRVGSRESSATRVRVLGAVVRARPVHGSSWFGFGPEPNSTCLSRVDGS